MAEEQRMNRSIPVARPEVADNEYHPTPQTPRRRSKAPWIILVLVIIVLAVAAWLFRSKLFPGKFGTTLPNDSGYSAVFLTNGQVYFGKLSDANKNYVKLTDIFYLQVVTPPLQGSIAAAGQP